MAAADIIKRTPQKAIDLNVYSAAHGGSGTLSLRLCFSALLPSASADRFMVMARWEHLIVHLGCDLRYDPCFVSVSLDSCNVL